MTYNENTIKVFIIIGFLILISAIIQKKFPYLYEKIVVWDNSKDIFKFKSKFISKLITACSFFIYSIFMARFPSLRRIEVAFAFVILYHIYIWIFTKILQNKDKQK